jgi:hypothetical protein
MAGSRDMLEDRLARIAQLSDPAHVTLGTYSSAVHELRAVALDARTCIERAASAIADARAYAHRRRRRAEKATCSDRSIRNTSRF